MKIRTSDNVLVIKGKDRGRQGRVQHVFSEKNKVLVEGVNIFKRHTRPAGAVRQGGIIQKELPIEAANVMVICTHCNAPTKIGARFLADGTKARICKKCQEVIE